MGHPIRAVSGIAIVVVIPLLMAMFMLFPADADVATEEPTETPAVMLSVEPLSHDADFEVTIETGTVVVLSGSVISAKTVTATTTPGSDPVDSGD